MVSGSTDQGEDVTEDTMHQDFMRQLAAHHADLLRSEAVRVRRARLARRTPRRNPSPRSAA
jgi:hypothetical protein